MARLASWAYPLQTNGRRQADRAALAYDDQAHEQALLDHIDRAICELYRGCYFDPRFPVVDRNGLVEYVWGHHSIYQGSPTTPFSPIDLNMGLALAFWHVRRRAAGSPVATPRFPQPPSAASMEGWPLVGVPEDCLAALGDVGLPIDAIQGTGAPRLERGVYPLFTTPPVARRPSPAPPPLPAATALLVDRKVTLRAEDRGDVATGIVLERGQEFAISATGEIWAGELFAPRNGPEGLDRLVDDARWPLHSGLDGARARAYCLLGRLNGYFFIGSELARTRFVYHEPRELFLRVNDGGPGDGDGAFEVRVRVWGQGPPPENPRCAAIRGLLPQLADQIQGLREQRDAARLPNGHPDRAEIARLNREIAGLEARVRELRQEFEGLGCAA